MKKLDNRSGVVMITLALTCGLLFFIAAFAIYYGYGATNRLTETQFKTELANYTEQLKEFVENKITNLDLDVFERESLVADESRLEYNTKKTSGGNISTILPEISPVFQGKLEIQSGELVLKSLNKDQTKWAEDLGIKVISSN